MLKVLPKEPYKKIAVIVFYSALALILGWFALKYLLPTVFPFIISYIFALFLQRPVNYAEKHRISRKLSSLFLVVIFSAVIAILCYFAVSRAYSELLSFTESAADFIEKMQTDSAYADKIINKISLKLSFIPKDWIYSLRESINEDISAFYYSATTKILPILGDIIGFVPNAVMLVFVVVLSSYYFTLDFDKINRKLIYLLPPKIKKWFSLAKAETKGTIGRLFSAYALIMAITFGELFIGLSLIGIEYALVISAVISVVDILPVLGTGMFLIPWGIILLLIGNNSQGFAILALYAVITVVRELSEPKILGKTMGTSPLLTLITMYIGLELFGFSGLILLPVVITVLKSVYEKAKAEKSDV